MPDEDPQKGEGEKPETVKPETEEGEKEGTQAGETPPVTETPPEVEGPETDKEPGGSDGQSVYQRKLYRENKQLREEVRQRDLEKARLEERVRLQEEAAKKPPEKRRYTTDEIQAAIDAQQITAAQGAAYLARVEAEEVIERRDRERQERETKERPLNTARNQLGEYVSILPWLADDGDERTQQVSVKYQELIRDYGMAPNEVTKALAVRQSVGELDKVRKQKEMGALTRLGTATHAELPGGGRREKAAGDPISKVPQGMVSYWRTYGATEEQVKKYAQQHLDKVAARRVRFGA